MSENILLSIIIGGAGFIAGIALMIILSSLGLNKIKKNCDELLHNSNQLAESTIREAVLEGKSQAYELKLAAEKEAKERRQELNNYENRLSRREELLNSKEKSFLSMEKSLEDKTKQLNKKYEQLELMENDLNDKINQQLVELERIASLNQDQAREIVLERIESEMDNEIATYIRDRQDEAMRKCDEEAKELIALAIDRFAQDMVNERTVSMVQLPNEEMKGRIIGREGRNIRAFEAATGVEILIDDTPEVISLSCFNPIRREIARQALEALIKDGRIQPGRIEEVVAKAKVDIERSIQKAGEDAIYELGINRIDREIVKCIGKLKYRYSYGQNALMHSIEVAHLAGIMASELGLNVSIAKRAGLLHDIGKALDFEMEGTHVELGARLAKKYGEHQIVVNAIESHHGDCEKIHLISNLVAAADTLSAARPGARYENYETYIQRLEQLEAIANSYEGVSHTYAIQAGREVRVMVIPEQVDDNQATLMARKIKDEIEEKLTYPGQIKVVVIREVRKQEIAK